jgi:hypothetical protein
MAWCLDKHGDNFTFYVYRMKFVIFQMLEYVERKGKGLFVPTRDICCAPNSAPPPISPPSPYSYCDRCVMLDNLARNRSPSYCVHILFRPLRVPVGMYYDLYNFFIYMFATHTPLPSKLLLPQFPHPLPSSPRSFT